MRIHNVILITQLKFIMNLILNLYERRSSQLSFIILNEKNEIK